MTGEAMTNVFGTASDNPETIECRICGHKSHSLYGHLDEIHGMTKEEYLAQFPGAPLLSPHGLEVYNQQLGGAKVHTQLAAVAQSSTPRPSASEVAIPVLESFGIGFGKDGKKEKEIRGYAGFTEEDGVPAKDANYVFQQENTRSFILGMVGGGKVYLHGPTGSGKTTLPEQFAARTGRPFFRQQFYGEMEPTEILGTWTVVDGGSMVYLYSGLALAIQQPSVVVLDEYDSGNPTVTAICNALLEGKPLVLGNKGGERIQPHPDCLFVATGNTNGMGDETGLYTSTTVQSFATMNRFQMFLEVNYLEPTDEIDVLKRMYNQEGSGVPSEILSDVVKVANFIREGFVGGKITAVMSTRQVINWCKWIRLTGNEKRSYDLAFGNQLGPVDRAVCEELFQRVFGK